jgi:sigma-B regulation protein RsbU (phosphoserine phosphatase)
MKADLSAAERRDPVEDCAFGLRVSKARHDLHNSIGHIVGFSEMWGEDLQEQGCESLQREMQFIYRTASEMMTQISEGLNASKIEAGLVELPSLQRQVSSQASQIIAIAEGLARQPRALEDELFKSDLARIAAAARHVSESVLTSLDALSEWALTQPASVQEPRQPLGLLKPRLEAPSPIQPPRQGAILIVDDQEENRELLSRRLSPLGYSVQMADSGQGALDMVAARPPDLILLDILMPGRDGFQVLHALKAAPATQHIPVIMLSALDDEKGIARCIEMGAEDYLAKPFNPVFLQARVSACMEKKRLADREKATYEKLVRSQKKLAGELSEAAAYVRSLLPAPLSGAVKAEWCFQPSAELGGDAFGYHWLDPDHLTIYLLDVCGHGVGAALLSVSVLNALRTQTLPGTDFLDPAGVLSALNRTFQSESQNNLFFSMWYGVYRPSNRQLTYASAGHHPALLLVNDQNGKSLPVSLRTEAPAVGCLEAASYSAATQAIPPGARLMVFSDGVFEIFKAGDRAGTWTEFLESFALPEVQGLRPSERLIRALEIREADSLEDDFSFVEFQFD